MNQTSYLNYSKDELLKLGGYWTAKEIEQQPAAWVLVSEYLQANKANIEQFMQPILALHNLRIILTGAGTSAFAGGCLAPTLAPLLRKRVEAIATTDLVSNPTQYFENATPTLMVSFARSGNSPESLAAVELASQMVENCYHLVITCNADGALHQSCYLDKRFSVLMPAITNDVSFAMTSSFTSMLFAALSILSIDQYVQQSAEVISAVAKSLIGQTSHALAKLAGKNFERVVYLGSGGLKAIAQEAALKLLELTDGKVVALHDTPLGFRHGPKTIINDKTLVVVFMSNDAYTRQYDADLLAEIRNDNGVGQVLAISATADKSLSGEDILIEQAAEFSDVQLAFSMILCAQIYAFHHALKVGNSPDTPSADGTVNRVVKGVTIYPINSTKEP